MTQPKLRLSSSKMATALTLLLLLLTATLTLQSHNPTSSPHLTSPHTFHLNHNKMLHSFKIYIYPHNHHHTDTSPTAAFKHPTESAFYSALLNSSFLTTDPDQAHLFFIPFPLSSSSSSRSISRLVRDIRSTYPFWNRTLGADHFYLHCDGLGYESDRNLVELKKNAVQISCFPTKYGYFIPHKDITFPPFNSPPQPRLNYLRNDLDSKYCLMSYDDGSVGRIGEALREGCVPVVVVEEEGSGGGSGGGDLPMLGVVRWAEMAVFVGAGGGGRVEEKAVRRVVRKVESGGGYERMRELGSAAARHLAWGEGDDQYDAFHSVMYQLWVRRHVIRYSRVNLSSN